MPKGQSGRLLLPLWQRAARLLNTTLPEKGNSEFLNAFYSQIFFWASTYKFPDANLRYVPIWKAANNAIRCNLKQAEASKAADFAETFGPPDKLFQFTVVREPLNRFISGVSEINFRGPCAGEKDLTYTAFEEDSKERAFAFLQDLLSLRLDRTCHRNWHIFSMLGPLTDFQSRNTTLDWVAKLERLDRVWHRLGMVMGSRLPPFDDTCGAHPQTSNKDYAPRRAMKNAVKLLAEETTLVRSRQDAMMESMLAAPEARLSLVCAVLLPDYVCFEYKLPTLASDCVRAGFAPSQARWKVLTKDIREHMCPTIQRLD